MLEKEYFISISIYFVLRFMFRRGFALKGGNLNQNDQSCYTILPMVELHIRISGPSFNLFSYIHFMNRKLLFCFVFLSSLFTNGQENKPAPTGSLFIIGGGRRSPELMQTMLQTAQLKKDDYIVVLPMASAETDTAYFYFKKSLNNLTIQPIVNFNFTADKQNNKDWLDSLKGAKLIFIAGGDQSRFMKAVLNTPVYDAIHQAYKNGATIAGTSAGAAVMSKHMITGNELRGDTAYNSTFRKVWDKNIEFTEGLGLMSSAIIDQHFIARSRYNRLLSALAQFPDWPSIGIDEATAIIVQGNKVSVAGASQVVVLSNPKDLKITDKGLIKFKNVQFAIYTAGDEFSLD